MSWIVRWVVRGAILWAAERLARKVADRVADGRPKPRRAVAGDYEVTAETPVSRRSSRSE